MPSESRHTNTGIETLLLTQEGLWSFIFWLLNAACLSNDDRRAWNLARHQVDVACSLTSGSPATQDKFAGSFTCERGKIQACFRLRTEETAK